MALINLFEIKASSPDELALVNFAKFCGVVYKGKDVDDNMTIEFQNK